MDVQPAILLCVAHYVIILAVATTQSLEDFVIDIPEIHADVRDFPPNLQVNLTSSTNDQRQVINLTKSAANLNVPLFRICGQEKSTRLCAGTASPQNEAFYQNRENGASLSVIRVQDTHGHHVYTWSGFVLFGDTQYDLHDTRHSGSPHRQYNLIRTPDVTGLSDFVVSKEIHGEFAHKQPYTKRKRRKRQNGNVLRVELLIVIDNVIYQTWYAASKAIGKAARQADTENNLRRYFAHVVNGMDLRYRAIKDSRFQISVTLVGYVVGQSDIALPSFSTGTTRTAMNADTTLGKFRDWVRDIEGFPAYDHVMLFTGHDIYTIKNGVRHDSVTGLAYLGLICTRSSVSLVEYHGGFSSARIATHELAHSLGASHDGDGNSCRSSDQYIMTGKAQPTNDAALRSNPWTFSSCSLDAFAAMVMRLKYGRDRRCLFDTPTVFSTTQWTQYVKQHPGQWFNVDETCRQFLGPTSYMCRDLMASQEEICTALWCHRPNTNQCRQHIAPRGTSCGNRKWCIDGECKPDNAAPAKPDNCVHGNHPGAVHKGRTCSQIVTSEPYYCYQKYIKKRCCGDCNRYYVPILGCEYGNRQTKCPSRWCSHQGEQRSEILSQCCGTCRVGTPITNVATSITNVATSITNVATPIAPSPNPTQYSTSSKCADVLTTCVISAAQYPSRCYSSTFEQDCCASCRQIRSKEPGCFYGDRDPPTCRDLTNEQCHLNDVIGYNCCATCQIERRINPTGRENPTGHATSHRCHFILTIFLTAFVIDLLV